jgi:hypothetical protein
MCNWNENETVSNFGTATKIAHSWKSWTPATTGSPNFPPRGGSVVASLKGLSHEIFTVIFWLEWIYIGLKGNRFWFLNFKDVSSILDSNFKYWRVPYQIFSEICRISEKDWQLITRFSNFSLFWVSVSPRNAAKGVNTSRRFVESPRMIDNQFSGSPRMFNNNISVSIRQLSILLGDSTNLREGLVWSAPKLKIVAKNRRSFKKVLKP